MSDVLQTHDLDTLMRRVRADVQARKSTVDAESGAGGEGAAAKGASAMAIPLDRNRTSYRAGELLAFHDVVFLRAAFIAVLGREPDREANDLLRRLRLGEIGKTEALATLLATEEAHSRNVRIRGLWWHQLVGGAKSSAIGRKSASLARITRNIPRLASYIRQVVERVDVAERKVGYLQQRLDEEIASRQQEQGELSFQVRELADRLAGLEKRS